MYRVFTLILAIVFFGCAEVDSDESDWVGQWYNMSTGGKIIFHENGTFSGIVELNGIEYHQGEVGSYLINGDKYIWTLFETENLEGFEEYGTWEIEGDLLKMYPDDSDNVRIFRRI